MVIREFNLGLEGLDFWDFNEVWFGGFDGGWMGIVEFGWVEM